MTEPLAQWERDLLAGKAGRAPGGRIAPSYKIKIIVCDPDNTPLYWEWLGLAQPGDTVHFEVPGLEQHPGGGTQPACPHCGSPGGYGDEACGPCQLSAYAEEIGLADLPDDGGFLPGKPGS